MQSQDDVPEQSTEYQNLFDTVTSEDRRSSAGSRKIRDLQEQKRGELASTLLSLFGLSIIASLLIGFALVMNRTERDNSEDREYVKDLITIILASQTGLVSTALGFYFGSGSMNDSSEEEQ